MNADNGVMKLITKFGLMLLMGGCMSAEAGLFSHTTEWKEEVKLNDGQVMVVERHYNLGGYPTLDGHERSLIDETFTFTLPDSNQKISWKTEFRNDVPELNSLSPLLLDVVGGIPYLATTPAGCIAYNKWGRPNPPYVLYKYVNDEWKLIPLEEFPAVLVHANLMGRPASNLLKPYYTVEAAKAVREDGNIDDYAKTILREALPQARINAMCMEMIPYKGSWVMPNDPIAKKFIDAQQKK